MIGAVTRPCRWLGRQLIPPAIDAGESSGPVGGRRDDQHGSHARGAWPRSGSSRRATSVPERAGTAVVSGPHGKPRAWPDLRRGWWRSGPRRTPKQYVEMYARTGPPGSDPKRKADLA